MSARSQAMVQALLRLCTDGQLSLGDTVALFGECLVHVIRLVPESKQREDLWRAVRRAVDDALGEAGESEAVVCVPQGDERTQQQYASVVRAAEEVGLQVLFAVMIDAHGDVGAVLVDDLAQRTTVVELWAALQQLGIARPGRVDA